MDSVCNTVQIILFLSRNTNKVQLCNRIYYLSIYLSGLVTAVAIFRNPNTIPFCLTTDLLLNVLFSWLLVHLPSTFFLDVLFFFFPLAWCLVFFSIFCCLMMSKELARCINPQPGGPGDFWSRFSSSSP